MQYFLLEKYYQRKYWKTSRISDKITLPSTYMDLPLPKNTLIFWKWKINKDIFT